MGRTVSIGAQGFDDIRQNGYFYVDKTDFIKQWWKTGDKVTLITRPRRFGKTLNMNMLECFFSTKYAGRADLFEGLDIWKDGKYRDIQGTWPVIFLSFAKIKAGDYKNAREQLCMEIFRIYSEYSYLLEKDFLNSNAKEVFNSIKPDMSEAGASSAINNLCMWLNRYYNKNVIIILDEYDTPMQEAWISGYWNEIVSFMRNFFNATFKTNPYLERAVMTGITRVSKESIFSDLNNLNVVTTTSSQYADCFGFTEDEVFASLDEMGLSNEKEEVKKWYDGFTFGSLTDIYNPWSITNFLKHKGYSTYWADTSGNGLISSLLCTGNVNVKKELEDLMHGGVIEKEIDEQIIFSRVAEDENAMWSLMVASGYLRIDSYRLDDWSKKKICSLKVTNFETLVMFNSMIKGWFARSSYNYNSFVRYLLEDNVECMNIYINKVALDVFSFFDTGSKPSEESEPERFYHGFVLGLIAQLRGRYEVKSNRESGYGRYDVMMTPQKPGDPGIVIEFKVFDPKKEKNLEDTIAGALAQIEKMKYATELEAQGIAPERIRKYGFAFKGKDVLIG